MVDSGELLEPFVARNAPETNMYRRGSLIVISSVEDSHSGLLETFQPRSQTHCIADDCSICTSDILLEDSQQDDTAQEKSAQETLIEDKEELLEPTQPSFSRPEPFKCKPSPSVVDYIWDSLSVVGWLKASSYPPRPTSESSVELREAELVNSRLETAISSVKETEDFRRIQNEMRSTRVLTGGGAHAAMTQLLQQRRETALSSTSSRTLLLGSRKVLRRKSNSFSGFPTRNMTELDLQASNSSLVVNLSPFASDITS